MARLGLALSGGGFRATLFHLGVVRFLRDAEALRDVTDIASVSGGSVLAAHLALNWEQCNGDDQAFAQAASQIVKFVQFDVRNHVVRRLPLLYLLRALARLTPWRTRSLSANSFLEHYYRTQLYGDRCLHELPESPRFHILTTNVSNGGLSVFNRSGLYIQQRSAQGAGAFDFVPGQLASIPKVVCASSAFPGFFPPVAISAADLGVHEGQFATEWFTDGGVYDNLGTRAFLWLNQTNREFDQILVSDAGKPFQVLTNAELGLIGQSVRATDILWDRVWQLERENFGHRPEFLFIPITDTVDPGEDPTALHPVVQPEIQTIRTDLDRFSPTEINALAKHGYEVARQVYRAHSPPGAHPAPDSPPWAPLPDYEGPRPTRANSWTAPATLLARKLRPSGRRRVYSTLLDPRDWPSYVYVALAALLFLYVPYQIYKLHRRAQVQATVIEAISQGDPDIREIFHLIERDPTDGWVDAKIVEKATPSDLKSASVEILTRSRIVDLRGLRSSGASVERGFLYARERLTVKLLDSADSRQTLILHYPTDARELRIRVSDSPIPRSISHITAPVKVHGQESSLYEVEFQLSGVPHGEPVTLELEGLIPQSALKLTLPVTKGRYQFESELKTDLATVWLLFPADRPYRTYSLIRYPADRGSPPEIMQSRFTIDHPYGTLIGWSVINPEPDTLYECRWSTQ
jgi:predicted acylesterase/phospholipase RssA